MRHARFLFGLMAGSVMLAGCMRPFFTSTSSRSTDAAAARQGTAAVSVRFFMPPDAQRLADMHPDPTLQLAGDPGYTGFAKDGEEGTESETDGSVMHVALWGGPYHGHETTFSLTSLQPGDYTFAMIDQEKAKALQGWIHVNYSDNDLADILRRWKAEMPKMKQWLAFDFELQGKLDTADAEVFKSFARQLRAFERLERELDQAIEHELQVQASARQRNNLFLHDAEVLLFPGDRSFFRPTTKPAFTAEEIAKVQEGDPASKMVLVADYPTAQWKLGLVNQLTNELQRCKAVFVEEADRLARRKRFYTLTDHIYNHDRKFVENEMRLQQCLATIDRMNQQTARLGERRMALAFITGLFAPEDSMAALDRQEQDLVRERKVLETQKERFDTLFQQTDEDSARRVVFERSRQDAVRAIENVDTQLAKLTDARNALQRLRNRTEVIYRQGDQAMVAASFFDTDVPFPFRQTVEREALMSVRVEPTDSLHIPSILANMAAMRLNVERPQEQLRGRQAPQRHSVMHTTSATWRAESRSSSTTYGPVSRSPKPTAAQTEPSPFQTRVAQQRSQPEPQTGPRQQQFVEPAPVTEPVIVPAPPAAKVATEQPAETFERTTTRMATRKPAPQPARESQFDESRFDEPDEEELVWEEQRQQRWQRQEQQSEPQPKQVTDPWERQAQRQEPKPELKTRMARQTESKPAQRAWEQPEQKFESKVEPKPALKTRTARQALPEPQPAPEPVIRPSRSQLRTTQAKRAVTPEPAQKAEVQEVREARYLAQRPDTVTEETRRHERTVYKRTKDGDAKLTSMQAEPRKASDRQPDRKARTQHEDCPWIIKVLVPPCWFLDRE